MDNKINHIITRVLSGESSSEDILSLSEWLNENEANRKEFRYLKNYWDAEVTYHQKLIPDLAVEQLQQRIKQNPKDFGRIFNWKKAVPFLAAATLLFVFTASFFIYYTNHHISEYYTLQTNDQKSEFTMPDGSVVTLNKQSRLRYSNLYGKKGRNVQLEGEAFFDVVKNQGQTFEVELNDAVITVKGTRFNVKADTDHENITATLEEGSICFSHAKQHILLTPGQQLSFNRSTQKIDIKQVDTDVFTLWKDNLVKYKSIPFAALIAELQKEFDVELQIVNSERLHPSMTVSGTFCKEQNIEQILKVISRSIPIKWHNNNGVYYIQYIKK